MSENTPVVIANMEKNMPVERTCSLYLVCVALCVLFLCFALLWGVFLWGVFL